MADSLSGRRKRVALTPKPKAPMMGGTSKAAPLSMLPTTPLNFGPRSKGWGATKGWGRRKGRK